MHFDAVDSKGAQNASEKSGVCEGVTHAIVMAAGEAKAVTPAVWASTGQ